MATFDLGQVVGSQGAKGDTGKGITSISKTGSSGLIDTYTITYSDSTTSTFTVTNGSDASVTIQTSWGSTTSDSKVPSEKLVKTGLDGKSDSNHNHTGTYAPLSHTQASSTITDMTTVTVVVTYTDSTTETMTLFKQTSS